MINEETKPEVGQQVLVVYGPNRGLRGEIRKIAFSSGARNGWYTVQTNNGSMGIYAGEELEPTKRLDG